VDETVATIEGVAAGRISQRHSQIGCEQRRSSSLRTELEPASVRSGGGRFEGLLRARESERLVGRQASRVHGAQHRNPNVGVVVDADGRFPLVGSHEATGVLDEAALEGDGEGEEERVELRAVEALAELLAGCDDDERFVRWRVLDLVEQGGAGAPSETSLEHERLDASALQPFGECILRDRD
jgi:hypothetical protein